MAALEHVVRLAATGNRFAVLDAFDAPLPADPAALARRLCADPEGPLDGLLLLTRADDPAAEVRMIVHNADGGRPEACGNGLRCVAKLARERGHVRADALVVQTDAGARRVALERADGRIVAAHAELGVPRVVATAERLAVGARVVEAFLVELGNPHCVLFVDADELGAVGELGPALERHPRFPAATNVELVAAGPAGIRMRVWERGVGETASCGTGAAAAACGLIVSGRARSPLSIELPGGTLDVRWDGPRASIVVGGPVGEPF